MSRRNMTLLVGGLIAIPAVFGVLDHVSPDAAAFHSRSSAAETRLASAETAIPVAQQATVARRPAKEDSTAKSVTQQRSGDRGREKLKAQNVSVVPAVVESFSTVCSVPPPATSISSVPLLAPSFPAGTVEQLHSVAEGKTFVIRLERADGDYPGFSLPTDLQDQNAVVGMPQFDPGSVQPMGATLYCDGFEIASARNEKPSEQLAVSPDESQSWPTPPTESLVESDPANAVTSSETLPSEEPEGSPLVENQSEAAPATIAPPSKPTTEAAPASDSEESNIELVCNGEVTLVFRTSMIKANSLSYADGKFQLVDAVVTTPFGELNAPTLSLTFPLDGVHIQRVSSAANSAPSFDAAVVPPGFPGPVFPQASPYQPPNPAVAY